MSKKGFTLTELLAIIVILAIIMLIAAPALSKEIKRGEEENQNIINGKIENAAKMYVAKYYADTIVGTGSGTIKFTLDDLQKDGLLDIKDDVCTNKRGKEITVHYGNGVEVEYDYKEVVADDCYKQKTN